MRKLIAAINMTLDGFCDHTAVSPGDEIHKHYSDLLEKADCILYGRITYQLMEFWRSVLNNPTGNKTMDDFAIAIDAVPKIVFSRTLKQLEWKSAKLAERSLEDEVFELKQQAGKDIFVGSPGLIAELSNLCLIDEYQICIHPVIAGRGSHLFKNTNDAKQLKLINTKTFAEGAVILYYEPVKT